MGTSVSPCLGDGVAEQVRRVCGGPYWTKLVDVHVRHARDVAAQVEFESNI